MSTCQLQICTEFLFHYFEDYLIYWETNLRVGYCFQDPKEREREREREEQKHHC
jgi:hypothetical protein